MVEKSQVVLIKVSAQEIQGILQWYPGEGRHYIKTDYALLGSDSESVKSVDKVLGVLHMTRGLIQV
jgi:hypothetical protein